MFRGKRPPEWVNPNKGKTRPKRPVAERFWEKVDKRGPDECWPWLGGKNKGGYGAFYFDGRDDGAHRVALRLSGVDVPRSDRRHSSGVVDHICRNVGCVNPRHLRLVSQYVNAVHNSISPHAINATKTHCKYGHEFTPENTHWHLALDGPTRFCLACYAGKHPRTRKKPNQHPDYAAPREAA